jgi:hypothetical protein
MNSGGGPTFYKCGTCVHVADCGTGTANNPVAGERMEFQTLHRDSRGHLEFSLSWWICREFIAKRESQCCEKW